MSKFPTQLGVTYTHAEAEATLSRDGERTITVSMVWNDGFGFITEEKAQLEVLSAASLLTQLREAIDAHYVDHITPKAPGEVL